MKKIVCVLFLLSFFNLMGIANNRVLISFEEDVSEVRSSILSEFPVGTNLSKVLLVFPEKFVVFDADFDKSNGFILPGRIADQRDINSAVGVSFLKVIVNKDWPKGLAPFVNNLYLYIGFDEKGRLVDVQVFHEVNSI